MSQPAQSFNKLIPKFIEFFAIGNISLIMNRKFTKCLITGISGSGGSYLAEHILNHDKNIKIYGIYNKLGYAKKLRTKYPKRINIYKVNLSEYSKFKKIIKKINPDLIYNFASNANVKMSFVEPKKILDNNCNLIINFLEVLREIKSKALIIICSTSEVYGNVKKKDLPITEKNFISPVNPYSVSKTFQDLLSQVYFNVYKLNIIITRMFTYTNPRRNDLFQTAFAKQIVKLKNKKNKKLYHGNLNSIRSFLDIDDASKAYWECAKKGRIGEIYNIGGDTSYKIKYILKKMIQISNIKNIKTIQSKYLTRPIDVTNQIPNSNKFRKETGWKPKVNLKVSLKNLLNNLN